MTPEERMARAEALAAEQERHDGAMTRVGWVATVGSFAKSHGNSITASRSGEHFADHCVLISHLFTAHSAADMVGIAALRNAAPEVAATLRDLVHDLRNAQQRCIALEHTADVLAAENAESKSAVLLQAARLAALESELATLQAAVVAAMSSAGPDEDERVG